MARESDVCRHFFVTHYSTPIPFKAIIASMETKTPMEPRVSAVPWQIRDLIWASGLILVAIVAINVAYLLASRAFHSLARPSGDALTFFVLAQDSIMLVALWRFSLARYHVGWDALGLRGFDARAAFKLGAQLFALAYAIRFCYVAFMFALGVKLAPQDVVARLDTTGMSALLTFFAVTVFAPVVEELFFRGFIYGGLRGRIGATNIGATIVSALIFTALHSTLDQFISILVLGLFLAWLYEKTGSLIPGIVFHGVNNAIALVALYALKGSGALPM